MSYFDFTSFKASFYQYIKYVLGKKIDDATKFDFMNAVSSAVGKFLMDISFDTNKRYKDNSISHLFSCILIFFLVFFIPSISL